MNFSWFSYDVIIKHHDANENEVLRPVTCVVQVINDINEQDCTHDKQISQCTKMRICIHHQQLITSRNHYLNSHNSSGRLQKQQYTEMLIYIGFISENTNF